VLTGWKYLVETFRQSGEKAGEQAEKRHVSLLLVISLLMLGVFLAAGFGAAIHFHESAGAVAGSVLVVITVLTLIYWVAFGAHYQMYAKECGRADTLQRRVDEILSGGLIVEIDQLIVGEPANHSLASIAMVASVSNTGEPSIAQGYSLRVLMPDGSVQTPSPEMIPQNGLTLYMGSGPPEDHLRACAGGNANDVSS
jgi:hypothetical protein